MGKMKVVETSGGIVEVESGRLLDIFCNYICICLSSLLE